MKISYRVYDLILKRGEGNWKIWRSESAYIELVSALEGSQSESVREQLLADNSELADATLVEVLNAKVRQYGQQSNYLKALMLGEVIFPIATRLQDQEGLFWYYLEIGHIFALQGQFEEAEARIGKAIAIAEKRKEKNGLTTALGRLAVIYSSSFRYEKAAEVTRMNLKSHEEAANKVGAASTLANLGRVYSLQGRYSQALEALYRGLGIIESLGQQKENRETAILSSILSQLGEVYFFLGKHDSALLYLQSTLDVQKTISNRTGEARSRQFIGSVLSKLGRYAEALEWLKQSRQLWEDSASALGIVHVNNEIGEVYLAKGEIEAARRQFIQSLNFFEGASRNIGISRPLLNLIILSYQQQDYEAVLKYGNQALQVAADEKRWQVYCFMGQSYVRLGNALKAKEYLEQSILQIELLRRQSQLTGEIQQLFFEQKTAPYFSMTNLLVNENLLGTALGFAEQAKARVLLDVLQNGRINIRKSLSIPEQQAEEKMRLQMVSLNAQMILESQRNKTDQARLSELKGQLDRARLNYSTLETRLYAAHPEWRVARGESQPLTFTEAATLLPDHQTALLEFAVGEDKAHLFVITGGGKDDLRTYAIDLKREDLGKRVEQLRKYLADKDLRYNQPARELYDLLLKPAAAQLQGKTRLVIVPDGPLWELPFQALMPTPNRFLVEDKTISTAPSLTFLREMMRAREKRGKATSPVNVLAIGNPALGGAEVLAKRAELMGDKLEPLPFAEQQAVQLGQLYKTNAKVLTGAAATEAQVKAEMGKYRILHLATHGVLDDRNPMYSHLVLAQTGNDKKEDGLLEARELLDMDLQADLAVLSACETGRGKIGAGEGMIGLTWALFVAGVPTTVVSQWKVADQSTAELMVAFHRNLQAKTAKGVPLYGKAEALRRAGLSLLKQPNYRHPFHWAGFVLVGDGN